MSRITVIGSGFAALTAIRKLRKSDADIQIDVIAPAAEFVFLPGTIWIPTGLRKGADLRIDLHDFFQRMRVNHHKASATGLQAAGREVIIDSGVVENDGLIIACGGRFIKKLAGIEHSITPCEGIPAAEKIRDRIAEMKGGTLAFGFAGNPREPAAMRGGPVFEFLFGIDRYLCKQGRREQFKLIFFTPAEKPGQRLGPKAVSGLLKTMKKRGIETHLGHKMKAFESGRVVTEGGDFAADLIVFMPGMTGNKWFDDTELPRSPGGMIQANEFCQVVDWPHTYVAGDAGSFPGPEWLPKQAHMADLQAEAAVTNLLAELKGDKISARFKAELLCIIDSFDTGSTVLRNEKYSLVTPPSVLFHWAKRLFEWHYLHQYRSKK